MLPQLRTVLARQRRDYGIDEESFEMQYPVFDQAAKIDETPVHNIGMERQCGKVDYRLKSMDNYQLSVGPLYYKKVRTLGKEKFLPSRALRKQPKLSLIRSLIGLNVKKKNLQREQKRNQRLHRELKEKDWTCWTN